MGDKERREELDSVRQEVEAVRSGMEQDKEQLRSKLREIADAPDPIRELVRALRGETRHVPRRTH